MAPSLIGISLGSGLFSRSQRAGIVAAALGISGTLTARTFSLNIHFDRFTPSLKYELHRAENNGKDAVLRRMDSHDFIGGEHEGTDVEEVKGSPLGTQSCAHCHRFFIALPGTVLRQVRADTCVLLIYSFF